MTNGLWASNISTSILRHRRRITSQVDPASQVEARYQDPEVTRLVQTRITTDLIKCILWIVCSVVGSATAVSAATLNTTGLYQFATTIIDSTYVTTEVLLVALCYMVRGLDGMILNMIACQHQCEQYLLGSLILAAKYTVECCPGVGHWRQFPCVEALFSMRELRCLEVMYMKALNYDLSITDADIIRSYESVRQGSIDIHTPFIPPEPTYPIYTAAPSYGITDVRRPTQLSTAPYPLVTGCMGYSTPKDKSTLPAIKDWYPLSPVPSAPSRCQALPPRNLPESPYSQLLSPNSFQRSRYIHPAGNKLWPNNLGLFTSEYSQQLLDIHPPSNTLRPTLGLFASEWTLLPSELPKVLPAARGPHPAVPVIPTVPTVPVVPTSHTQRLPSLRNILPEVFAPSQLPTTQLSPLRELRVGSLPGQTQQLPRLRHILPEFFAPSQPSTTQRKSSPLRAGWRRVMSISCLTGSSTESSPSSHGSQSSYPVTPSPVARSGYTPWICTADGYERTDDDYRLMRSWSRTVFSSP